MDDRRQSGLYRQRQPCSQHFGAVDGDAAGARAGVGLQHPGGQAADRAVGKELSSADSEALPTLSG